MMERAVLQGIQSLGGKMDAIVRAERERLS